MRRRQSRSVGRRGGVLIVTLTVLAAGLVASPAQAYDNSTLHYRMATVTTIAGCPTSSYATIQFELSSGQWATIGTYRPPGTSATIDYNRVDLSWPEVMGARVQVYDDADRTDLLCAGGGRT